MHRSSNRDCRTALQVYQPRYTTRHSLCSWGPRDTLPASVGSADIIYGIDILDVETGEAYEIATPGNPPCLVAVNPRVTEMEPFWHNYYDIEAIKRGDSIHQVQM
jgi:hypothetical protein